jgi:hypothetical protein
VQPAALSLSPTHAHTQCRSAAQADRHNYQREHATLNRDATYVEEMLAKMSLELHRFELDKEEILSKQKRKLEL